MTYEVELVSPSGQSDEVRIRKLSTGKAIRRNDGSRGVGRRRQV